MKKQTNYKLPLLALTVLFFMMGFITVLNDILVPHLKALFSLDYVEAMLVQFCFFLAYGVMSIPCGKIIHLFGYKKGLVLSLFIAGIGCLIFLPAAQYAYYPAFLLGLFILACGIVLLQVAANPYVSLLGPPQTASSRLDLVQAFNSLGTTVGPLIGSQLIFSLIEGSEGQARSGVEILYLAIGALLFLLAIAVIFFKLPPFHESLYKKFQTKTSMRASKIEKIAPPLFLSPNRLKTAWIYPHLLLGSLAVFFYVGAEVSIGSFLVNFLGEIASIDPVQAGKMVSLYWGGAMVGRFLGFLILLKIQSRKVLAVYSVINIVLVIVTVLGSGYTAVVSILMVGLFNSIMFPTIFTLSIAGLDAFTPQGSGIFCTAIVGGAVIPLFQGWLADTIGLHHALIVPLFCYLYIFYFAVKGSIAYCRLDKI